MRTLRTLRLPAAAALCSAILLAPMLAVTQEKTKQGQNAIDARQGIMRTIVWEAGPLFAMAKGDIAYDAEQAAAHAGQLDEITDYDITRLFIPDTSKSVYGDETRALATIWEEPDHFSEYYQNLRDRVAEVAAQAGEGQEALAAAVQEMGKACGNCHDDFRADD
jgi:cytochrome c556